MNLRLKELNAILGELEFLFPILPHRINWYSVDGIRVFEIRGWSGGVVSSVASYLISKNNGNCYRFGMRFTPPEMEYPFENRKEIYDFVIGECIPSFVTRLDNPKEEDKFDPDGGDLGLPPLRSKK